MARFNEILVGRYNRALQKLLQMKGPASLVTLSDEMFAVYPFFHGVETRYLEGWQRYRWPGQVAAVAAQQGSVQIRNLPGSNVVGVIESIQIASGNAQNIDISLGSAAGDLTLISTGLRLDPRGQQNSSLIPSVGNNFAELPIRMTIIPVPSGGSGYMTDVINTANAEWPILPGDTVRFTTTTVNTTLFVNLCWRERFLEESERA